MAKRISFMIFLLPILLCSIISISEAFHSNANKDDTTADPNDQRPYTRENSTNPAGQGGYYGGHDTLTAEGILLKKDVHKNESDGGERFKTWAEQDALPWFRTGVHDEDSTKLWEVIPLSESPIGPNGPGDFRKHFYNPDTGEGLKGWETPTTTQALNYINELSNRYLCQPGMMNQLSPRDRSKMYDYLGRILHLVQDMGNPAHSRDDHHIYTKTFEDYVNDHWDEIVNSDDFKLAVTAPEYLKGNYENFSNKAHPIFYPDEFVKVLANVSKDYPTDGLGIMSNEELQENVRFLIPETIKYTAGYIDAIYSFFKNTEQMGDINICKQLPQGYLNPGGGHPDDRFDVSDEFYWEKEFNLSDGELTDLYLRTAVKKGKIGVWYKKQYWTTFFDGRTTYKNAPHEVLDALEAKFQAIGKKLEQRPKSDWKGAPDIALFTNGFHNPSISLMLKIGEPVSFQGVDFDPEIVKDHPILFVPSAGFYGLSASDSVRAALDEYVKNGGILIAFSQQYGSDWSLLPTPDDPQTGSKKPVTGYGYQEDQNCQFNSVYVDTYHPILSGFSNSTASIGVDGYFLSYPENATVLLRRTANGQPAMILYPYGQGYVIATVLFTDFALTHNQANLAEIGLIQDMISWAKKPDYLLEVKPGESVSLSMLVANHTDVEAASLKLIFLSPGRKVIHEQPLTVAVPAGQSITVPASYTTPPSSDLGIYHVDYILLDGQGNIIQPQAETDSGRFVVSNPPQKYTSDKPVLFSVTTSSQEVLFGTPLNYTFHVYNNTEQVRNLTLRSYFGHTGRDHEWKIAANPKSETTLSGTDIFIDSHWYFETLRSYLYDETMKLIGAYDLSFTGVLPSASITAQTEKKFYRQGETVPIHGLLKNNSPAAWQANIVVRVLNNNNVKIFEDTKAVSLSPLGTSPIGADFLLPQNAESGAYTVRMEARDGNILVHAAAASFQVIRSQISVSPSLPSLLDSGAYMLVFGITNSGNVDVTAGVLKVNLKDPGGEPYMKLISLSLSPSGKAPPSI